MKQLIEDYKRRIEDYKRRIAAMKLELNSNYGNSIKDNIEKQERLIATILNYETFIPELEHELTLSKKKEYYDNLQKENVQAENFDDLGREDKTNSPDNNNSNSPDNNKTNSPDNNKTNNPIVQTDNFPDFIARVDFSILRTQKASLIEIIDEFESEIEFETDYAKERNTNLIGILNLIDALQDYAVDIVGMNPIDVFDIGFEESREDVIKTDKLDNVDIMINGIIIRKKQGIDCTEEESAIIKDYLRELKSPSEQAIVANIQLLFPKEYSEYLYYLYEEDELDGYQNGYL